MNNVKFAKNGKTLTITVDLSKPGITSASGKSKVIASTNGNVSLPEDEEIKVGLNIYKSVK